MLNAHLRSQKGLLWVLFSTVPMRELTRSVSRTGYSEYHLIPDGRRGTFLLATVTYYKDFGEDARGDIGAR